MKTSFLMMLLTAALTLTGCQPESGRTVAAGQSAPSSVSLKPRAVEILRAALRSETPEIRINAVEIVAETQQKDMMADVLRLMDDPFAAIRFAAVTAAGDMRCFGCEQDVRKRLTDADENVRLAAAYSLTKLNYAEYFAPLRQAAGRHDDATVRANAVLLLGKAGDPEDIDLLYRVMRDDHADERIKFGAIDSIARLKDIRIYRSKLWALLISKYADDRVMGIRGMGALGTPEAKNAIITMLSDDILEVRLAAAEELGRLGDKTGRPEVAAYLGARPDLDRPEIANILSVMAIGYIDTPDLRAHLPKALSSRSEMIRLAAAQSVLLPIQ